MARSARLAGFTVGAVLALAVVFGGPATAQILPTTTTTTQPSTTTTARPTTTTTRPATTTSARPATTTSRPSSTTTESTPPSTISTPTPEGPTDTVAEPSAGVTGREGEIAAVFPLLSLLGFGVALAMLGTRWYSTRPPTD